MFYMTLGVQSLVKVIFGILLFIYVAAMSYCYPLFARYHTTWKAAIFNSFALTFRHLPVSVSITVINAFPLALVLIAPAIFWKLILAWTLIGFSLCAYLNAKLLMTVFRQYENKEEED